MGQNQVIIKVKVEAEFEVISKTSPLRGWLVVLNKITALIFNNNFRLILILQLPFQGFLFNLHH